MIVSVTYPHSEGSHFDTNYYLTKHMPLVRERWTSLGLKGTQILKGSPGPDGVAAASTMMVLLDFESAEAFGKAVATHGDEVMGDVPNFTDIKPVVQFNETLS